MNKLLISFVILMISNLYENTDVDNFDFREKYLVAFCANTDRLGHAFISYGYESDKQKMTVHGGTWGLYPKNKVSGVASYFIGEVPGELRPDFKTISDRTLVLTVTSKEYEKVEEVVDMWRSKNYELTEQDCLTFVIEVASIFENLKLPKREGSNNLPAVYLSQLIKMNK